MIFASKEFFLFLPVVLLGYHLLAHRGAKFTWLLLASWLFYAWASPGYLWVILALTVIDYAVGIKIEDAPDTRTRKRWLVVSIVSNLAMLGFFKYALFFLDNGIALGRLFGAEIPDRTLTLLLPLGISFHTFQGISYTIDVYRRQISAVRSFRDYAFFVAFFPQLAAGPIVRASEFLPQMVHAPRPRAEQIQDGLRLFMTGLFKKLVIADQLHLLLVDPVFTSPADYSPALQRWAICAWAVQIYCDFSGYTDLALGCAKWFGFELPANFRLPYLATSITDFWRRWHLSLSTWLRDYLYFPLGGSRGSELRTAGNLILVFVLCGLWHGAAWNWLVYGLFNGILMVGHRHFDRAFRDAPWRSTPLWSLIAWCLTMAQLLLGLILIRMTNWNTGLTLMHALAVWAPGSAGVNTLSNSTLLLASLLMLLGVQGHIQALIPARLTDRLGSGILESGRGLVSAAALVGVVLFSPGLAKSFIYIAF